MADFDINRLPAKPTERVIKAKEMFLEENPEMCCQRAIIYTEVYGVPGVGGCGWGRLVPPSCSPRGGLHADAPGKGAQHLTQVCGGHSVQVCRRMAK